MIPIEVILNRRDVIALINGYSISYPLMSRWKEWGKQADTINGWKWDNIKLHEASDTQLIIILEELRKQFEFERNDG